MNNNQKYEYPVLDKINRKLFQNEIKKLVQINKDPRWNFPLCPEVIKIDCAAPLIQIGKHIRNIEIILLSVERKEIYEVYGKIKKLDLEKFRSDHLGHAVFNLSELIEVFKNILFDLTSTKVFFDELLKEFREAIKD